MRDDTLNIVEHFTARREDGTEIDMTVYDVPIDDSSRSYMLMLEATDDVVISETYMHPEFPKDATRAKFDRKLREYLETNRLSKI